MYMELWMIGHWYKMKHKKWYKAFIPFIYIYIYIYHVPNSVKLSRLGEHESSNYLTSMCFSFLMLHNKSTNCDAEQSRENKKSKKIKG